MTTTTSPRGPGTVGTVALTYVAALLFGAIGAGIGAFLPCSGFLCNVGYAMIGALVGVLTSAPVAALVARRSGVRWWYTPVAYGMSLVALVLGATANSVLPTPDALSLFVLAASGPLLGAVAAAPGRLWWRVLVVAVVAIAFVTAPIINDAMQKRRWNAQDRSSIQQWLRDGPPLYAPVSAGDAEVVDVLVMADPGGTSALYDMQLPGVAGQVRVHHTPAPSPGSPCAEPGPRDLGGGLTGLGAPDDISTVCIITDDLTVSVTEDGFEGQWRGDRLVDFARSLEPTDPAWLNTHFRER